MRLFASLLTLVIELNCMAGFRDREFSSVGRAPVRIEIVDKQDEGVNSGSCIVQGEWTERGRKREEFFFLSKEDFDRVQVGKRYSFVKTRAIKHADPWTVTCYKARAD